METHLKVDASHTSCFFSPLRPVEVHVVCFKLRCNEKSYRKFTDSEWLTILGVMMFLYGPPDCVRSASRRFHTVSVSSHLNPGLVCVNFERLGILDLSLARRDCSLCDSIIIFLFRWKLQNMYKRTFGSRLLNPNSWFQTPEIPYSCSFFDIQLQTFVEFLGAWTLQNENSRVLGFLKTDFAIRSLDSIPWIPCSGFGI